MKINIEFFRDKDKHSHKKEQFIIEWDKELGWKRNPFVQKILDPPDKFISGYLDERLKINLFVIKKFDFGVIFGEAGTGKTTILRWMEHELKKHSSRLFVNFINGINLTGESQVIKQIVEPLLFPHEKLVGAHRKLNINNIVDFLRKKLSKKRLVILIDNVGSISDVSKALLTKIFNANLPVQIIVAGTKDEIEKSDIKNITPKDHLKINLGKMPYNDIRAMIKKRIESVGGKDILPFNDDTLQKLAKQSDYNPKKILDICYNSATELSVEQWHVEQKNYEVRQEQLKKEHEAQVKEEQRLMEEESKLRKIKEEKIEKKYEELVNEDDIEKEVMDLKTQGYKEKDFDTSIDTRKKRIQREKELNDIFDEIEENLKKK